MCKACGAASIVVACLGLLLHTVQVVMVKAQLLCQTSAKLLPNVQLLCYVFGSDATYAKQRS
jgi:hypothetical protein